MHYFLFFLSFWWSHQFHLVKTFLFFPFLWIHSLFLHIISNLILVYSLYTIKPQQHIFVLITYFCIKSTIIPHHSFVNLFYPTHILSIKFHGISLTLFFLICSTLIFNKIIRNAFVHKAIYTKIMLAHCMYLLTDGMCAVLCWFKIWHIRFD